MMKSVFPCQVILAWLPRHRNPSFETWKGLCYFDPAMGFVFIRKRPRAALAGIGVLLFLAGPLRSDEPLSPEQKLWLEDVTPIITKTERDVFLHLRTASERAKFIAFFWKTRDSTPDTAENEFKREYMERVRFADRTFGHESPKRGSQTERGYYYLVLGKPLERTLYTTNSEVWPCELWFYKGEVEYGLPAYFYLIFYQDRGIGDYRLYYPGIDGPEKLAIPQATIDTGRRADALKIVKQLNSELGAASISYLPGEQPGGMGTSSDNILASIREMPEKKFSDAYARAFLSYKDFIETEYADNYLNSAFQVKVFKSGGQPFLHWSIEPEKMNFAKQESSIHASFELVLRLEDARGLAVFERTEEIPLRLTSEQYRAHERMRFAFQDILPVIPGRYKALFLLKNKTARDFSSTEVGLSVPAEKRALLSVPILYHSREAVPEAQRASLKAFSFGGFQYLVGARNEFLPGETPGVFFQAWNVDSLNLGSAPSFALEIFALETGASLGPFPLSAVEGHGADEGTLAVSGTFSLANLKPGYYRAEVSALAPDGRKVLSEKENFIVLTQAYPVLPWVYARLHGPFPGPEHLKVLGTEYFLAGEYTRAADVARRVLQGRDDPATRLLLAKSLYGLGRYKESLAEAAALYERVPDRETAKVIALDYAGLRDWPSALTYLEKLMAEATEVSVLNLAAECQLNLDRPEKALPLLQKSLSLLPDQPSIRELEAKTKKRLEHR
jgi:GWxTD domain-containing protein